MGGNTTTTGCPNRSAVAVNGVIYVLGGFIRGQRFSHAVEAFDTEFRAVTKRQTFNTLGQIEETQLIGMCVSLLSAQHIHPNLLPFRLERCVATRLLKTVSSLKPASAMIVFKFSIALGPEASAYPNKIVPSGFRKVETCAKKRFTVSCFSSWDSEFRTIAHAGNDPWCIEDNHVKLM